MVPPAPASTQELPPDVAGCFRVWELTPDARQERVLLSPNLEFVYAEAVERVTEGGIVAIPVTEEFAVLDRDDPLGLIALWRTGNESVHMT
jgi:hypothetical protein